MNHDWQSISTKTFEILKGTGFYMQMYDKFGDETLKPTDATRLFATKKNSDVDIPKLKSYSILVTLNDDGTNSSLNIKTPTSTIIGAKNFLDIESVVSHLKNAVGLREDLLVHWSTFNQNIKLKGEEVNNVDRELTESTVPEIQQFAKFLNCYGEHTLRNLTESELSSDEARLAIRAYDGDRDEALKYLISIDHSWRRAWEADPQHVQSMINNL